MVFLLLLLALPLLYFVALGAAFLRWGGRNVSPSVMLSMVTVAAAVWSYTHGVRRGYGPVIHLLLMPSLIGAAGLLGLAYAGMRSSASLPMRVGARAALLAGLAIPTARVAVTVHDNHQSAERMKGPVHSAHQRPYHSGPAPYSIHQRPYFSGPNLDSIEMAVRDSLQATSSRPR